MCSNINWKLCPSFHQDFAKLPCALWPRVVSRSADRAGGGRGKKMEGNRDEAEKCIHIATIALEDGDKEKALRFLNKAEKLYPTDKAKSKVTNVSVFSRSGLTELSVS